MTCIDKYCRLRLEATKLSRLLSIVVHVSAQTDAYLPEEEKMTGGDDHLRGGLSGRLEVGHAVHPVAVALVAAVDPRVALRVEALADEQLALDASRCGGVARDRGVVVKLCGEGCGAQGVRATRSGAKGGGTGH